jgi:hypothetical protein
MSRRGTASSLTASERLILAVAHAAKAAHSPTPELRQAVRAYVEELRTSGKTPEQALVAVKTLLTAAGLRISGPRLTWSDASHPDDEIIDRVVFWCIEAYFPPPSNPRLSPPRSA